MNMPKSPNNNGRKSDGTFAPGNALGGKTKGARHRTTRAVEELLDGQVEMLTQKAVEAALEGDMTAMRLCLERICPPRKERPIQIELPKAKTSSDAVKVFAAILEAVGAGEIAPGEGQQLASLVELQRRTLETGELEQRIIALETDMSRSG
jgi:hypothetical protein